MKNAVSALLFLFLTTFGYAQKPTMPDSLLVIKNRVKVARISEVTADGKKYTYKIMHYDSFGRVIREQQQENDSYYEYVYDDQGRMTKATMRTPNGKFGMSFHKSYNPKDTTSTTTVFSADSIAPTQSYTQDNKNRVVRQVYYSGGKILTINAKKYDAQGNVIAVYDSSGYDRTATWFVNGRRVAHKTYDPAGKMLHSYRFFYNENGRIARLSDSTGIMKTIEYTFTYDKGALTEYRRNKVVMTQEEISSFRKEFWYIFPYGDAIDEEEDGWALPVPNLVEEHNLSRDKDGNIIRDELKRTSGSFSETRTYVYEYEFY